MKYKIAIFDLDGTILNTLDDLADSLNVVLQKFQMPLHTYEQVRFMVGNGIPKLIERAIPDGVTNPKYQEVNAHFEEVSTTDITNSFRKKLNHIENEVGINQENKVSHANDGARQLVESLKLAPDTGPRLQGKFFNTIVRGARKGKFFLRSAASGQGKTRRAVGDACYLSYPIRYNLQT